MATLFAVVYPDLATAEQAAATARGLAEAGYLEILDSSLVSKNASGTLRSTDVTEEQLAEIQAEIDKISAG
jgi:hypothetical protein